MFITDTKPTIATLHMIPDGVSGIGATLGFMADLSKEGRKSMPVRECAIRLCAGLDQKDWYGEICALHAFVRDEIRYINDPDDCELVQTPEKTLELRAGDCDDKSVLLASLLRSIGHPCRYCAVGFVPGIFEHVYVESRLDNGWVALETTEPVAAGWEPPRNRVVCRMHRKA